VRLHDRSFTYRDCDQNQELEDYVGLNQRSPRNQVAIDLIGRLAVRVPQPELDVLKATTINLNDSIRDRVTKRMRRHIGRVTSAAVSSLSSISAAVANRSTRRCSDRVVSRSLDRVGNSAGVSFQRSRR
jgi:hypothetical protein